MAIRKKMTLCDYPPLLWTTLPSVYEDDLLEAMTSHPDVDRVRYNTGMRCDLSAEEILTKIQELTKKYFKPDPLIDLKGRQLRVIKWSKPPYGPILLNHPIELSCPAKVYMRGEDGEMTLKKVVNGNEIYLSPTPKYEVGEGQSVNIVARDLRTLDGYFTEKDLEFIRAAKKLKMSKFLFSFTESESDLELFTETMKDFSLATAILKIESAKGVDLVRRLKTIPYTSIFQIMAARDDLVIHVGTKETIAASRDIILRNRDAICASRLLMGLETAGQATLADVADIELMRSFGYGNFMLSDGISHRHFKKAMEFWTEYKKELK
ncbi:MAG: hypothetical protein HY226_05565 [Candidatus Vogelbacteria bacterium]|nr:hypothetical protein [Candidatus Vogelbacteria bacterium]